MKQSIIILCILVWGVEILAQPTFLYPADGPEQVDLPTSFNIRISKVNGFFVFYDLELSQDISFASSQGAPDYQGRVFSRRRNLPVKDLAYGERYYIRTRSWSLFTGYGPYRLDSVYIEVPTLTPPILELVDGLGAQPSPVYANQEIYDLSCTNVLGANEYNWQFDMEGDFISPEFTATASANTVNVNTSNLVSGQSYFVRVQARNIYSGDETDFSSSTPVQYFNALHPIGISLYGNTISRRSFKLWTDVVDNGDEYIFQVSTDPGFSNLFDNPKFPETQSSWPGVSGVVFKSNRDWYQNTGWQPSGNPVLYKSFDFVRELNSGQVYYFRVRAANSNQMGYWGPVHQIMVDPPPLTIDVENISNGESDVPVDKYLIFSQNPNYDLTEIDVQISMDAGFTSLHFNGQGLANTRSLHLTNLSYNSTYYLRVRAHASNSLVNPGIWSTTKSFNTSTAGFDIALENVTDGETNITLEKYFVFTKNPYFNFTSIDVQIATDSLYLDLFYNGSDLSNVRSLRIPNFSYNTVYYLRVRAYADNSYPAGPTEWSDLSFTTVDNQLLASVASEKFSSNQTANHRSAESFTTSESAPLLEQTSVFKEEALAIYPNPVEDDLFVNLNFDSKKSSKLTVFDMRGRLVYSASISKGEKTAKIDFSKLNRGYYTLKLTSGKTEHSVKVIKVSSNFR